MPRILKRPQAEKDLDEIWWFIAQDNPSAADRFLDELEEQCRALAQFPKMGVRGGVIPPLLKAPTVG